MEYQEPYEHRAIEILLKLGKQQKQQKMQKMKNRLGLLKSKRKPDKLYGVSYLGNSFF